MEAKGEFHKHLDGASRTIIKGLAIPTPYKDYIQTDENGIVVQLDPAERVIQIYDNPHYFSGLHAAYEEGYTLDIRLNKYADAIQNTLTLGDIRERYIDLGGGPGYFSYGVALEAVKRGIISPEEVAKYIYSCDITKLDPRITNPDSNQVFTVTALNALPYADNSFGTTTCFHVLEHIPPAYLDQTFSEIHRIMKPRGKAYFIIPTTDGVVQRDPKKFEQIFFDETHLIFGEHKWWEAKFKSHGFSTQEQQVQQVDRANYGWVFVAQAEK